MFQKTLYTHILQLKCAKPFTDGLILGHISQYRTQNGQLTLSFIGNCSPVNNSAEV